MGEDSSKTLYQWLQIWLETSWKKKALLPIAALLAFSIKLMMPPSYPCPGCGTDLVGRGHNCPECGYAFTTKGEVRQLRRELDDR